MAVLAFVFGAFGLIVGSFLNVLVLRYGVRSVGGRSGCMACGSQLTWFDMIPVISWIALTGKCRRCFARIGVQYPLVEAVTAILFALIGGAPLLGIFSKILFSAVVALLVAIAVYDLRHTIIPDPWVWTFNALALVSVFLLPAISFEPIAFLAGPIAASPLFALWLFSGGRWMGLGDVKLALGIGWLLGPTLGITAIFFAFIVGAAISVFVLLPLPYIVRVLYTLGITSRDKSRGGFTMKSEIPFGPFLILSCIILWLCILYGVDLNQYFGLFPRVADSP